MKPQNYNHPDMTAYVMGELDPTAAARMRGLIACSPEASAEYDRIKRAVSALQTGASIPECALKSRQRDTVLAMSQKLGRASKIAPFTARPQRESIINSWLFKLAAAACLTIAAFIVGHQTATPKSFASITQSATKQVAEVPPRIPAENNIEPEDKLIVGQLQSVETNTASIASLPNINIPSAVTIEQSNKPLPHALSSSRHSTLYPLESFIIAATHPETAITLRPDLVRPTKTATKEFAGITLAAPMMENLKAVVHAPVNPHKMESQPSLVIHSWKAEIASCPWDSTRRLMRFVVQIPVDQAAIESNEADYRLSVKFDPALVRGYRLVTEKHMPPSGNSNLATRFAWYEIIPTNNSAPSRDKPASLGVMKMVQPRETKDSQSLRLIDRGLSLSEAREDFAFETAMIGFNLLLQGANNIGSLNYKLVLDLAEQSRGEDVHGERTKFIETVEQAQRAAGL